MGYGQTLSEMGFGYHNRAPQQAQNWGVGGYYDINGMPARVGYYDIGAAGPGGLALRAPVQMQLQNPSSVPAVTMQRPSPIGGLVLTDKTPSSDRVLWLGFKFANIASAAAQAVSSSPQDTFSPRKIVLPGSVAPNFEINDIKVGAISQFSSSDPVPAEAFIPNSQLTDVHFDTAQISQQITFLVTNISNATATFRAALIGFVVRM